MVGPSRKRFLHRWRALPDDEMMKPRSIARRSTACLEAVTAGAKMLRGPQRCLAPHHSDRVQPIESARSHARWALLPRKMTASIQRFLDGLTVASVLTTVVDVALVYYLIYRLLLTIRGTRAAQMIVGIVLIGAAFFVAQRVELTTVSWLLDNFISYFIILIIVVFQQDIRRALGRIGSNVLPFGAPPGSDVHGRRGRRGVRPARARSDGRDRRVRARRGARGVRRRRHADRRRAVPPAAGLAVRSREGQRAPRRRGRDQQEPSDRARPRAVAAVARDRPGPRVRHPPPRGARHHRGHGCRRRRGVGRARRNLAVLQGLDRARPRARHAAPRARRPVRRRSRRDDGGRSGGRGRGRQGDREHRRARFRNAVDVVEANP